MTNQENINSILNEVDKKLFDEGIVHLKDIFTQKDLRKSLHNTRFLNTERVSLPEHSEYLKLFKNNKIRKAIYQLLGTNDYHLTTLSSNTLFNGVDKRSYHVDWPYHKYTDESGDINTIYQERLESVQVIIPLDDFIVENGATMYVPYSYLARRYPSLEILHSGQFEVATFSNKSEKEEKKQTFVCKKKYMLAKVGDVIVYPSTLWHSQGLNTTIIPRRALLANFSLKDIKRKDYDSLN